MAQKSAFLTAIDEKKLRDQQGFNAPAPMESIVDTVGQAPAVQSPFSQAAAPSPMAAAVDPMAQPDVLAAAPAAQAPQELTADSLGPVSFSFPEPKKQSIDTRLELANKEQAKMDKMAKTLTDGQVQKYREEATVNNFIKDSSKKAFEYFFGAPTAEQAQSTLDTQPTDPAQRARLQATAAGEGVPSDLSQAATYLFGRPENAGDPNILGPQTSPVVEMATPDSVANLSVNGTDTVTPEAITEAGQVSPVEPQAQLPSTIQNANGQNLAGFKPKYEGQSLTDFMAGRDDPSAASVQVQDPQGRFRRQAAPVAGETPEQNQARTDALFPEQADFREESAAREARQAARPDFGDAQERAAGTVTDRERRAARGDGMSDADRRDIAKANQRGASAGDVARGEKVAAALGIDRKTGKPLEGVSGKELAETGKIRAETAQILSEIGEKSKELNLTPAEESRDKTAGTALAKWDDSGRATVTSNIAALDSITKGLEDGQIKTRGFIDALPFGSDWARAIVNPDAQDAKNRVEGVIFQTLKETLGAQFTEKEGKRLVEASYNPMLSPEANAARLRDYSNGLKKAVAARESQLAYLKENKTLQGYDGATPAGIMSQVGSGVGGSQIQGDVNYQSDIQSKADQILSAQ